VLVTHLASGQTNWATKWLVPPRSLPRNLGGQLSSNLSLPPPPDRGPELSPRRSEPSSRTALNGEQPYPWDLLQPQDAMTDIEVPNLPVDVSSWGRSACYPRRTFYPLKRWPFHSEPPDHYGPTFVSARLVCLAVKLVLSIILFYGFPTHMN